MAGGGGIHGRQRLRIWFCGPLLSRHSSCPSYPPFHAIPCVLRHPLSFLWIVPSSQGAALCPPSKPSLLPHPPAGPGYAPLREEAVRLFLALQALEGARRPGPLMQGVLQTCRDLPALQDELFLQLAKQTSGPAGPPGLPATQDPATLRYWQLLTCMSCTFRPGGAVRGHLLGHLER